MHQHEDVAMAIVTACLARRAAVDDAGRSESFAPAFDLARESASDPESARGVILALAIICAEAVAAYGVACGMEPREAWSAVATRREAQRLG